MSPCPLSARNLHHAYGPRTVLTDLELELEAGKITVILGENGAGKTTLLRILGGDLLPLRGQLLVNGIDLHGDPERARSGLVYVAQHPPLAPLLSLREHAEALIAFRQLPAADAQAQLTRLCQELHLSHAVDWPVRALSGGMAHKAALILGFLAKTPVMILDEPHAGLDVRSALALRGLLMQARQDGTAILLASHLAEATLAVGDRALVLAHGHFSLDLDSKALTQYQGNARLFEQDVLQAMGDVTQ